MIVMKADSPHGVGAIDLRREQPGMTLGDLVRPGMLIQSGPDADPYLVDRIAFADHYQAPCWSLSGWYAPGGVAQRNEAQRWWMNGWVAQPYAGAPLGFLIRCLGIYDYDCPSRDCLFIVIAEQAFASNRAGQLALF